MEVLGHIVVRFTRGVTEHINPEEPEYTTASSGYDPFESTGLEWYHRPVDELIYQEYREREATLVNYIGTSSLHVRVIDACSTEDENEEIPWYQSDEDRAMAWKRLRPSALRTACKSMYIGVLISVLTAIVIGSLYILISYLCYRFVNNCEFYPKDSIPVKVQWMRSISDVISCAFLYTWFFVCMLFLFRPYQLSGVKGKLILVICICYLLDASYRLALQALGISRSKLSILEKIPLNLIFFLSVCWQAYLVANHLRMRRTRKQLVALFLKMTVPLFSIIILAVLVAAIIYPLYNKQSEDGKLRLIIAIFAPVIGVVLKVISRICVQRLWNISHPGYSYVLLAPLYCATAVMFRMLQADLRSLKSIAILGIIHGTAEVVERSTMVLIDHVLHLIWKRRSAPWGSFRTPRRERLMADIAIMSMLFESTAIVSVNGILCLYQFIYVRNGSLLELLQAFARTTSVSLLIEWFFTGLSLTIETRYQNMAVMAVWQKRWKKHILVAIVTTVSTAIWISGNLSVVAHESFQESVQEPCKMPFT